ncbi:hypothetical protein ACFSX8_02970 [Acinetobacter gyllenbergii]|uniref:hypothetical protein n=1 Tax=Acinetobacter gyllenbergii TaxID=134534 RepID=UPI00363D2D8D
MDSKKKVDDQKEAVVKANEQLNLAKSAGANAKLGLMMQVKELLMRQKILLNLPKN